MWQLTVYSTYCPGHLRATFFAQGNSASYPHMDGKWIMGYGVKTKPWQPVLLAWGNYTSQGELNNLGSGNCWLTWANGYRSVHCAAIHSPRWRTIGPEVQHRHATASVSHTVGLHPVARELWFISNPSECRRLSWPIRTDNCFQMTWAISRVHSWLVG